MDNEPPRIESDDGSGQPGPSAVDDQTWPALIHVSGLAGFIMPLGGILAPLILWLVLRPGRERVNQHGKAALDFQLSMLIYSAVLGVAFLVALIASAGQLDWSTLVDGPEDELVEEFLLAILWPVVGAVLAGITLFVFDVVMVVRAAIRAGSGSDAGYWLSIPFIRQRSGVPCA